MLNRYYIYFSQDLVINVNRGDITNVLEENLQAIEEITGSLKIERSHSLVSLHFFKSLRKIGGGFDVQKTLTIFENDNLQKLFPDSQVLDLGSNPVVFIHYNQKLCMKEITKFLERSRVIEVGEKVEEHSVSSFSNGNKIVCSEEKLNLNVITGGPDLLKLQYKNYYQVLEQLNDVDVNALLGYHVFYREVTEEQFANRSITKYEGMDACGGSAWNVIFEEDPAKFSAVQTNNTDPCDPGKERCFDIGNNNFVKIVYNDPYTYIPNCKPFTPYAIYVTTVMEKTLAGRATGAQSDIVYARTNETNPSPVANLAARSPNPNSLEVSWSEPTKPNGIIDQYYVEVSFLQSFAANEERNYCDQKKVNSELPVHVPEPPSPSPEEPEDSTCPVCEETCSSEENPALSKPVAPQTDKVIAEKSFHDDIINKVFPLIQPAGIADDLYSPDMFSRRRRSVSEKTKGNNLLEDPQTGKSNESFISIQSQRHGPIRRISEANETILDTGYSRRVLIRLPGNATSVVVTGLRHYTDYEIRVLACHQEREDGDQVYRACSDEAILNTKTTHNITADDIPAWDGGTDIYTHAGNGSEGIIRSV